MEGRDPDRGDTGMDEGFDDWFDEPEAPQERRRRGSRRALDETPDDPWVIPDESPRERPVRRRSAPQPIVIGGREITPGQAAIIGGSAIVVLLAILAAAGVFSSSSKNAAPPVTTVKPPATTAQQSTTTTRQQTPSVPAPSTTLKPGATGAQVKILQRALAALGYSPGKIDGSYGPGTKSALTNFQTAQGLTADGVFGSKTRAALIQALASSQAGSTTQSTTGAPPTQTLKPGDTGAQVTLLQNALTALGYSPGKADGSYGPSTKNAVAAFQKAQGLTSDGIFGSQTLARLTSVLAATG